MRPEDILGQPLADVKKWLDLYRQYEKPYPQCDCWWCTQRRDDHQVTFRQIMRPTGQLRFEWAC